MDVSFQWLMLLDFLCRAHQYLCKKDVRTNPHHSSSMRALTACKSHLGLIWMPNFGPGPGIKDRAWEYGPRPVLTIPRSSRRTSSTSSPTSGTSMHLDLAYLR